MRFGPEGNPRQRRATAHALLAKASHSGLPRDFYFAERAVFNAGTSARTRASHFEQDLTGIEKKMGMPDVILQNRTEVRLLRSVTRAFGDSSLLLNFNNIFQRPGTSSEDQELAEQLRPYAQHLSDALPDNGVKNSGKPGSSLLHVATGRDAQRLADMTFLVALQPEVPLPLFEDNVIPLSEVNNHTLARERNRTIHEARLMAEIMLERFKNTDHTGAKTPLPTTVLSERYLKQRDKMRESIRPDMRTFEDNLQREYLTTLDSMPGRQRMLPPGSGPYTNLNDAHAYFDLYKATHPGLPWRDLLGPRRRKETTSPDEVMQRLRDAATWHSTEYGNAFISFAEQLAVTFDTLRQDPEAPVNLHLPVGGGSYREGYSESIMHLIVGNGERAIRSLRSELHDRNIQSQTTHPIPGTNLFMVITARYRGPHEQLIGDRAPRFLAGLKWERHVVSNHYLTPSVKRAYDINSAKIAA